MNLTIQSITTPKNKDVNKFIPQPLYSSITRLRLNTDRDVLNKKIKPFEKISFEIKKISFDMICCPRGSFIMGADDQSDNPKRVENVNHPFLLGETEVTQELYKAVMGYNPPVYIDGESKNPVKKATWYDAVMFCNKLSQMLGKRPYYIITYLDFFRLPSEQIQSADVEINPNANGFRLPTEKEWEYAAKAGTQNKWAGCNRVEDLKDYGWFSVNSGDTTHPVKNKKPNEWGFYDMTGNVREWCSDKYKSDSDEERVTRGGSWYSELSYLRSDLRFGIGPGIRGEYTGFRVASTLSE